MNLVTELSTSNHERVVSCHDYDPDRARRLTENTYQTVTDIFAACDARRILPQQAAIPLAERRLHSAVPGCESHADVPAHGMHPHHEVW